jgi:hypothetical protein
MKIWFVLGLLGVCAVGCCKSGGEAPGGVAAEVKAAVEQMPDGWNCYAAGTKLAPHGAPAVKLLQVHLEDSSMSARHRACILEAAKEILIDHQRDLATNEASAQLVCAGIKKADDDSDVKSGTRAITLAWWVISVGTRPDYGPVPWATLKDGCGASIEEIAKKGAIRGASLDTATKNKAQVVAASLACTCNKLN